MTTATRLYPLGDTAISIQFEEGINTGTHLLIRAISDYLDEYTFEGFIEYVPAFTSITLFFDPLIINYAEVEESIKEMLIAVEEYPENHSGKILDIPVVYGNEYGPDLDLVASFTKLSPEQVIALHTKPLYLVHMIGFAPGFPYLGGMDEKIAMPRKGTPRQQIPAGAVGIAGGQTGIYPISTPGGWQIIGRTPIALFDIHNHPPTLLKAGDQIRFTQITATEFQYIKQNDGH